MLPNLRIETITDKDQIQDIVLEAKYRIENQLNDAISSIHMYRDAIVSPENEILAKYRRIVASAYIITPYLPVETNINWKNTEMPGRLFHREYRGHFKFGAVTLRPGMSLNRITDVIDQILVETGEM
jgi:hypothetical protein